MAASAISVSVAPALRAPALWISMQYGHWVVSATAIAISSLYFTGMAPAATAALSKAQKAFINSGARLSIFLSLARFSFLYIGFSSVHLTCVSLSIVPGRRGLPPPWPSNVVFAWVVGLRPSHSRESFITKRVGFALTWI